MSLKRFFPYPRETVDYVANISDRFRYFYVANPKAACTGVLEVLQLAEVNGDASLIPDSVHDRTRSPLLDFSRSRSSCDEILESGQYFRFTYVRNPFSRVLSAYLDKIVSEPTERARLLPTLGIDPGQQPTFFEFLKAVRDQRDDWRDIHWATQNHLIRPGNVSYDYIGRFESFRATFPQVLDRIGVSRSVFREKKKAAHATNATSRLREFVGLAERQLILEIYRADFAAFGYGVDPFVAHL